MRLSPGVNIYYVFFNYNAMLVLVTEEANFSMDVTSLTVGGFNQPAVARTLIELPGNAKKGLSQTFLWLYPYQYMESLKHLNQ